jgi:RND family efflux transporter MFP subunit
MHPTFVQDGPGSCPICGMDLVPVPKASADTTHAAAHPDERPSGTSGERPTHATVRASAEAVNLAGVRTAPAARGSLSRTVRAVGTVVADETRTHEVHTRISGWVESLSVDFTGQFVRRGDPLLTLYSPELVASQDEYVRARRAAAQFAESGLPEVRQGAEDLVTSARQRLLSFDVPAKLLDRLDAGGEAQRAVTLEAPTGGFVTAKEVFAGSRVEPDMTLFTITDLSRIWVDTAVYEQEVPLIRVGQTADVTLPYDTAFKRIGRVSYIYPTLDSSTRTIRVRVELANTEFALKPGMYANVDLGIESAEGVLIPEDAVLDSGVRKVVFVETGEGVFEPREVVLGLRTDGKAEVLSGVAEGEQVVVRANFLLDSESRLRSAIGATSGTAGDTSGAAGRSSMPGMDMGAGQ